MNKPSMENTRQATSRIHQEVGSNAISALGIFSSSLEECCFNDRQHRSVQFYLKHPKVFFKGKKIADLQNEASALVHLTLHV